MLMAFNENTATKLYYKNHKLSLPGFGSPVNRCMASGWFHLLTKPVTHIVLEFLQRHSSRLPRLSD